MKIFSVDEWGGKLIDNGELPTRAASGIVIHHTAGANRVGLTGSAEQSQAFRVAREIQTHHRTAVPGVKPAWRDSGHHFLVSRGGLVLEGRCGSLGWAEAGRVIQGAHCGNPTGNATRFGIEVEGLYMKEPPPKVQWDALVDLCAHLSLWGAFQSIDIIGHRNLKPTLCPGDVFYAELPRLRLAVKARKLALMAEER